MTHTHTLEVSMLIFRHMKNDDENDVFLKNDTCINCVFKTALSFGFHCASPSQNTFCYMENVNFGFLKNVNTL